MQNSIITGAVVASVLSMLSASSAQAEKAKDGGGSIKCQGANECKGKGSCKSADNACGGKNGCKGKGWTTMKSEKDCTDKGGSVVKG